ncbi:hypothetical protein BDN72DRAFT_906515 [Pluteus cervinus]|uniref:Uncharacterized protein n=1 Tax=Pluteus cervinus TaxID=181527 RepID=A0ACD2ZZ85_9AGAR|nr:hypothetical protein BDN72DRAFT_906515 [Pluteus cervinus]
MASRASHLISIVSTSSQTTSTQLRPPTHMHHEKGGKGGHDEDDGEEDDNEEADGVVPSSDGAPIPGRMDETSAFNIFGGDSAILAHTRRLVYHGFPLFTTS